MPKKLYSILGIENEQITAAEIRTAYRKLAIKLHPDRNPATDAAEQFKALNNAYQILSDETKRKQYDAGTIDEKGEPISPQQEAPRAYQTPPRPQQEAPRAYQPRPSPQQARYQSRPRTREEGSFQTFQNQYSFYNAPPPLPAQYYFFRSAEAASSMSYFNRARNTPVFVYVTPSPLEQLLKNILNVSKEETTRDTRASRSRTGVDVELSPQYKKSRADTPEHVFVRTNYSPAMERVIDRLLALSLILEQLDKKEDISYRSSPGPR